MKDVAPREFNGPTERIKKGLLIVYTGDGKGKSTAAYGTVFRSLGRGFKVAVVQFIKGPWISGEIKSLEKFGSQVEYHSVGEGFTWDTKDLKKDVASAKVGWKKCLKLLKDAKHDVYLFDEIIYVLKYKFLTLEEVLSGLNEFKPSLAHVILTGRDAPVELIEWADLVTEMKVVKHPFQKGILAQPGIDY
ncbi:MAG: Cob(I)yrinic acid a,c-diamide adenosyltransferase [Elusimicrobia bacterium]|nr:Cob(I)yrinic acid a,c-diamide adenosyltransferase [Elusimicrobiota bacterium]